MPCRRAKGPPQAILPPGSLQPVGFTTAEGILPYSDRSFLGYRLLQEYFSFPEKFFFVDLKGLDRLPKRGFGSAFEILIFLKQPDQPHRLIALEQSVGADTFQLGCTPIVNLFERIAEPIRITQTKAEYHIVPDQHRQLATEVYSVDSVVSASYLEEPKVYEPFYSLRHGTAGDTHKHFWYTHRRPSFRKNDNGTDVYLSLVDLDFNASLPPVEMLTLHVTCTNRDQAPLLKLSAEFGELEPEGAPLVRARCLRNPTPTVRPPSRRGLQWRLISHLSLNHLSIVEKGTEALQEILRLYDFSNDPAIRKQIAGITAVTSRVLHQPRHFIHRRRLLPRHGRDSGIRRRPVRRHRRVSPRLRAAKISGIVRRGELVQPPDGSNQKRSAQTMAAPGRRTDPSLEEALFQRGYDFEFFQAARLLARIFDGASRWAAPPSLTRNSPASPRAFPWRFLPAPSTISSKHPNPATPSA